MSPFGPIQFSFPAPKILFWAALTVGVCLGLLACVIAITLVMEPPRNTSNLFGLLAFLAVFLLAGVTLCAYGIYNIAAPAEWHVTATHVFRARGERILRSVAYRGTPAPTLTQYVQ